MIGCTTNNPAVRRYLARFAAAMTFYILFLIVTVWTFHHGHPSGLLAYGLAVLPALPIIASLIVVGIYLREEKDEVVRAIFVETLLWGIGATLTVTTIWGFLENFAQVKHMDLFLVFPIFWVFVGMSSAMVNARYR
jgi:uncharacterized YccA/Bax inhibitor family protein